MKHAAVLVSLSILCLTSSVHANTEPAGLVLDSGTWLLFEAGSFTRRQ